MTVLTLTDVTVQRSQRALLSAVSLSIAAGQSVGLVGASGAGKSTLMRVALGLERPQFGAVRWGNQDPYALRGRAYATACRQIGAVFQHPMASLNPRRTAGEAIAEPLLTHEPSVSAAERAERVALALRDVQLPTHYAQRFPHELSGGEAQRVAIARALMVQPRLLLLDEPTSALDAGAAAVLLNLLRDLQARSGVALLVISHDIWAVRQVAARLVALEGGRIVADSTFDALMKQPPTDGLRALMAAAGP